MQREVSPWATRGLYALAAILFVFPLVELFVTTWPFRLGDMTWRYAAFGLSANYVYRCVVGVALAMAVAYWQDQPGVLRATGWIALAMAILLLPVMGLFAVDLPPMAELRGEDVQRNTLIGGGIQELKFVVTIGTLVFLGLGAREMTRHKPLPEGAAATGAPGTLRRPAG